MAHLVNLKMSLCLATLVIKFLRCFLLSSSNMKLFSYMSWKGGFVGCLGGTIK